MLHGIEAFSPATPICTGTPGRIKNKCYKLNDLQFSFFLIKNYQLQAKKKCTGNNAAIKLKTFSYHFFLKLLCNIREFIIR